MLRRLFILIVAVFVVLLEVVALDVRDFTFSHLGQAEGLFSERIFSVVQTSDGALWWSGKNSVERYNGQRILHYQIGNLELLSQNAGHITKLTLGSDSVLTAFDNKGRVYVYDVVQDRFELYADVSEKIDGDVLLNDVVMTSGGMWLGMREGLYFMQGEKFDAVVKGVYVNTLVSTKHGLLVCTKDGVLGYADEALPGESKLKRLLDYNVESGYFDERYNRLWLGGFVSGVHVLTVDGEGGFTESERAGADTRNPVRSICPYDEQTMLVGIDGMGVFGVNRQPSALGQYSSRLLFDANEGPCGVLHGNGIYALLRDNWGNIVVGSYSGGIDIARPVGSTSAVFQHVHNNLQSLQNDHVNCVAQWPDGVMIMGTDNGVSLHNPFTQQWLHVCHGIVVLSLCLTPQGTMLAATYGKGVYEITESGHATQLYSEGNVLRDDHVYKLLYDRQGTLWMGCLDGDLVQLLQKGCRYYSIHNVQDMIELPDGRMAVGTANGVWVVDGKTGKYEELDYSSVNPDDHNKYVYCLFISSTHELWMGTDGGGVYIYNLTNKKCRQLTVANGLPSNTVCSICEDGNGRIVIATESGLAFVSPDKPTAVVDVNYCYGLAREYVARAVVNLRNGHVLYGTTSGALIIDPDNIQEINYTASLRLLGVNCSDNDSEAFNRRTYEMLERGKLRLSYSERTFDLFFESINLRNQYDIVYQYQVSGGEWSLPSAQQYIRFTNLEPGNHRLLLRSVSRTCGKVLDEKELTLIVADPWWDSWWMWMVYTSLIILAFFGAWRVYQLHTKYMRLVVSNPRLALDSSSANQTAHFVPSLPSDDVSDDMEEEGKNFIERATRIVVENIADSAFSIDCLCREMTMSRTLFYVKLKSFTGKSPQDFIRVIRLERAAALLRTGRPVTDAAALSGFDNPKYFSTVFKKYFGVSPSKYQ